ncbi:MAG: DinB family protein [Pseudomonadota bacterium]
MYTWKSYYVVQADYQHWANEALFAALAHLKPETLTADEGLPCRSIHHTLDHLLGVHQLWLARLQGADPQVGFRAIQHPVWRELLAALRHETRHLEEWLEARPEPFFEGEVQFTQGEVGRQTLWVRDALIQLFTRAAQLRGQVAAVACQLGAPNPAMDYLDYRREMAKLLDEARRAPR